MNASFHKEGRFGPNKTNLAPAVYWSGCNVGMSCYLSFTVQSYARCL